MRKEGKSIRFRKRRFLRFDGTMLSHYKKKEAPTPTWEVDITECRVSVGNRSLELVLTLDGSSMSFFAVNTDEYTAWLKALKSAVSKPDDYYTFGKTLGKGSYGEVFLGCDKVTNEMVAIKYVWSCARHLDGRVFSPTGWWPDGLLLALNPLDLAVGRRCCGWAVGRGARRPFVGLSQGCAPDLWLALTCWVCAASSLLLSLCMVSSGSVCTAAG